ncbi:hypothetical protein K461DRAFT_24472 [Myriangium duriaei CBS 260.36]|uniref:Uncharacterized protein n=1 Tax=Myriangium duriaei CBS 260.36 TaxID=1168546 RepID=A0A9P4MSR4_9PEZI|nr:hypothetical protein K461DRAFT_24472 [Myriangium duriaei CBS 260.36]
MPGDDDSSSLSDCRDDLNNTKASRKRAADTVPSKAPKVAKVSNHPFMDEDFSKFRKPQADRCHPLFIPDDKWDSLISKCRKSSSKRDSCWTVLRRWDMAGRIMETSAGMIAEEPCMRCVKRGWACMIPAGDPSERGTGRSCAICRRDSQPCEPAVRPESPSILSRSLDYESSPEIRRAGESFEKAIQGRESTEILSMELLLEIRDRTKVVQDQQLLILDGLAKGTDQAWT